MRIRETDGRHRQRGQNTESKTPNNRKTSQREEGKKEYRNTRMDIKTGTETTT